MNIKSITKTAFFASTLVIASINVSQAAFWAAANGAGSCENVCRNNNANAITSGTYKNGQPFYICSANARNEGYRGGYNLKPNWSNACIVGWGGKEIFVNNYSCLCD